MRARGLVTDGDGGSSVEPFDIGAPEPGEVLVKIEAAGVCHTDHDIAASSPPGVVLGHEGAGRVEAVGDGVRDLAQGDRVLLTWAISCGDCFQCARGNAVLCETLGPGPSGHARASSVRDDGTQVRRAFNLGTLATATVVRAEAVVKLPGAIPAGPASLLGCGVMTGFGSVVNVARVGRGESVVVIGCGGVGLNAIQGARIAGADPIVAVDVNGERLDAARRFGATHVVRAAREDTTLERAAAEARTILGARGADFAFECTGAPALCAAPLAFVRHGGTAVQVSGTEQRVEIDMRLFEWNKTYINPLYGGCRPAIDFPRLFDLYTRGELMLDELVTRTYPLDAAHDAFDDMLAGRVCKAVIDLTL